MSKVLFLEALLVIGLSQSLAQPGTSSVMTMSPGLTVGEEEMTPPSIRDSLNPVRPFWIPLVEVTGLNALVDCFNFYVSNSEFAKISFTTIKNNFQHGFDYDADQFATNQFAHPYNGALFYNFGRSTGHDYWASTVVAMVGSWEWEYFAENEPPAINDWIQTSISGSLMGEMFYRISSLMIDESATGSERVWREIGAFVVAPTRGFNRLIFGRSSRATPYQVYEVEPAGGYVYFGGDNISPTINIKDGTKNLAAGIEFNYGMRLGKTRYKPFDFFRVNMGLNFGINKSHGFFYGYGVLGGWRIGPKRNAMFGFFQHYDYINNPVYTLGATAVGLGSIFSTTDRSFIGAACLSGILMGATNSVYADQYPVAALDSSRAYNFGAGSQLRLELNYQIGVLRLFFGYHLYYLRTIQGAPGDEILGLLRPKVLVRFWDQFSLGLEYGFYHRHGRYHGLFPDVNLRSNEQKLYIAYNFGSI